MTVVQLPRTYDRDRLSGPYSDETLYHGTSVHEPCNRAPEADEDAPRHYRPGPCPGILMPTEEDNLIQCDVCGHVEVV
jgi:hypothetical protein